MQAQNKSTQIEKQGDHSEEQGFFAQKIQIKKAIINHQRSNSQHTKSNFHKSPFEVKFLPWAGILKKQPIQALKTSLYCPSQQQQKSQKKKNKNIIQDHPYKLYATNSEYQLVYNRNKFQPIVNDKFFMSNQINLFHVGNKSHNNFKKIKDFDVNQYSQIKPGSLAFDSRFQSGNLHCVYKNQKSNEYVLFIQNDTNSLGYNQWFYFSIQRNQANLKYTFKIVNFKKKHSFFKYGCKPAVFSLHDAKTKGQGWSRRGINVSYQQSPIYIQQLPNSKFYCLSFDLIFENKDDYILIAMSLPYSYTKLINFLKQSQIMIQQNPIQNLEFRIKSICTSICGNDIPEITITKKNEVTNKKMIIILARQHPGEVWSSYMVEEMIRKLISSKQDEDINWLLSNNVFKIYPMINVDGVIYGNFRCDITGTDLNRRWKQTSQLMYPQIYEIKNKINSYKNNYKIQCCFDLHGHSKEYNIFCYSCKYNQYTCRLLPLIINKINNVFHFPSCTFGITRYKQTTARAAIYKIIKNQNVLTIQNSFYGSKINNQVKQFSPVDLFKMGYDILVACRHFLDKKSKIYINAEKQINKKIQQFTNYDKQNSGSQSDPSGDQIDLQIKIKNIFNKQLVSIQQLKGVKVEKPKVSSISIKFEDQILQVKKMQILKINKEELKSNKIRQFPIKKHKVKFDEGRIYEQIPITQVPRLQNKGNNKKTISFAQTKLGNKQQRNQLNNNTPIIKEKKKNYSFRTIDQPKSQRQYVDHKMSLNPRNHQKKQSFLLMRQSLETKELQKQIQNVRKSDQYLKRCQKFIPISMSIKNKANVTMFQQSIYNQDQTGLISMLLQNKRKIQIQKIKRNVQKSTYLAERQGKIKFPNREEKVVNFKSLKQNEKINKQIRKLTSVSHYSYLQ